MDEYSAGFRVMASSGGGGGMTGTKCGRWNPTNEQVKVLTQLFRSGLRTPSTDQIQRISMQLSCYGKIESKNVFYWFQNHKARERHKRRRLVRDEVIHNLTAFSYSGKDFGESDIVSKTERVTHQTLQLFPVKSFNEEDTDKLFVKERPSLAYNSTTEMEHLTLDLQLSFT